MNVVDIKRSSYDPATEAREWLDSEMKNSDMDDEFSEQGKELEVTVVVDPLNKIFFKA